MNPSKVTWHEIMKNKDQPLFRILLIVCSIIFLMLPVDSFMDQASSIAQSINEQEQVEPAIDFSRDILPILSDNCFACHGPDAATREGGFQLDQKESAFGEADSDKHPIVASDVQASEIIRRMRSEDRSERMPPPKEKKQPTEEQIRLLERWIAEGATWKEHWAFEKPVRPELPKLANEKWTRNPIDYFVLAKLEASGLQPSPEANSSTLVRRLYLDLTGLPPTPEQVDSFLNDDSPNAYETLVDQLLDSPHYGEHMATFWMDAARFADTNGYQNDFRRSMWLWRDWVINAYNDNMPFDQFVIEQLAGDMLKDATVDQKVASGFNRNHRSNTEGGSINEEWRVENVVDRVETTSTVFLGLTMGCARCHDHKFDPISQREFYQFYSYFNNVDEQGVYTEQRGNAGPTVSVRTAEFETQISKAEERIAEAEKQLSKLEPDLKKGLDEWIDWLASDEPNGFSSGNIDRGFLGQIDEIGPSFATGVIAEVANDAALTHTFSSEPLGYAIEIQPGENQHLDMKDAYDFDVEKGISVSVWVRPEKYGAIISKMDEPNNYRGFDMLLMPDGRLNIHLIHDWPSNATKVTTVEKIPLNHWTHVSVVVRSPGKADDVSVFLNTFRVDTTTESDSLNGTIKTDHPVWLGLRAKTPPFAGKISTLIVGESGLMRHHIQFQYIESIDRFATYAKANPSAELQQELEYHFLQTNVKFRPLQDKLNKARSELVELEKQLPSTMVMKELDQPRETYVLNRGVYDQPDKEQPVSTAIPEFFDSQAAPTNRLELAKWIVDGNNPLTARVAVNHFWARYFGIGILETPENFGVQSPPPSHPELLDWLATEFIRNNWDIKTMQKLIVTSATYRQASEANPESYETDPRNRMLARGPRFRLPAESIRDNALAISGLLSDRIGGPSIKPYQPKGLWEELAGGAGEPAYEQATDEDLYRRSLYIYRKRTVPHPTMTTFDGVGRDICAVARDRTNTPLQALALLNDTTYVEAARHLATRAIEKSGTDLNEQLKFAFVSATCRQPTADEEKVLLAAFRKYQKRFQDDPAAATKIINVGHSKPDEKHDAVQLATLTSVCSVILNLDEVITKE